MNRKKSRIGIIDENHKWWKGSKDVEKWAIKDKNGDWWLVSGSEFPEKKVDKHDEESKIVETSGSLFEVTIIVLASILGVSLAINLILSLGFFS